jgi:hypothetical protein
MCNAKDGFFEVEAWEEPYLKACFPGLEGLEQGILARKPQNVVSKGKFNSSDKRDGSSYMRYSQ